MCGEGLAFKTHNAADHDAAVAVARFAHTYDAPHALRHVQAYLTGYMEAHFKSKQSSIMTEESGKDVLAWALMADKFDMHDLCGHSERAMVMHWSYFENRPDLSGQLSSSALQRIAKGLNQIVSSMAGYPSYSRCPDVNEFIAWRQGKQLRTG